MGVLFIFILWIKSIIKALYLQLPYFNKSFVILSSGRSGSTLLVQYLNYHHSIICYSELLNREELCKNHISSVSGSGTQRVSLVRYLLSKLLPLNPFTSWTGFKLFNEQLEYCKLPLSQVMSALCNPPVIVLFRENLLETFVSLKIAERNGIWFSEDKVNSCSLQVDWEEFHEYCLVEGGRWKQSMRELSFSISNKILFISFEEIVSNRDETMEKVFGFLNLGSCYVEACSKRQNPQPLEEKVSNYSDIVDKAGKESVSLTLTKDWLKKCMNNDI